LVVKKLSRVGIIANLEKEESPEIVKQVLALASRHGWSCLSETSTAACGLPDTVRVLQNPEALAHEVDLLLVIGGDGTMLRVARRVAGLGVPLLGIKTGRLGFLTQITSGEIDTAFEKLKAGEFDLEERSLLAGSGKIGSEDIREVALNDFVISRAIKSRIIELDVRVDDQFVARYLCDGLIISTPTGSTAYSLASGGGIITPNANVFSITPICPHSFQNRTVVVNDKSMISVSVLSEKLQTILAADGQKHFALNTGDSISFMRSERTISLIHFKGTSFFNTLREKLHWAN